MNAFRDGGAVVERAAVAVARVEDCGARVGRLASKQAAIAERCRLLSERKSFADVARHLREAEVHRWGNDRTTSVPVRAVKFSVLTEREVRAESGFGRTPADDINITEPKRFDQRTGAVREGGMYDARLGPIQHQATCPTCGGLPYDADPHREPDPNGVYSCPGHEGRLELCGALYNCATIDPLVAVLRCFCWHCGELPGAPLKNRAVVAKLLERDIEGRPLDRAKRIALLAKAMRTERVCRGCMAAQRCAECARAPAQCDACRTAKFWRPQIAGPRNRSGAPGGRRGAGNGFTSFPFRVVYATKRSEEVADWERFAQRHGVKAKEYVLNPERARAALCQLSATVALLLSEHWPVRACAPGPDLFLSVLGCNDVATRRRIRDTTLEFLYGMVPRVLPVATNLLRPINNDVNNLLGSTPCEITLRYDELLEKNQEVRRRAVSASRTRRPTCVDTASETVDRGAVLRHGSNEPWFELTTADLDYVRDDYGLMQYLYVLLVDPSKATKWLPSSKMVSLPNSARRGAERTKNKGRGFATDQRGKEGIFRANLMGKRVDYSARSVIVGDPNLDADQLGVPYVVAGTITVPERLTGLNCNAVLAAAERRRTLQDPDAEQMSGGPRHRKGARHQRPEAAPLVLLIISPDNTEADNYMELPYPVHEHRWARLAGTVIERPLQNNDIVAFNRAPSLHKPSVMAHRVRLVPGLAFRLSLAVTVPYNADFDGDEMNMHGPQSIVAQVELAVLVAVGQNIVLQRKSGPCIALVQDHLLGASLLGQKDTLFDRHQTYQLMYAAYRDPVSPFAQNRLSPFRLVQPALRVRRGGALVPYWTGRQLISMLLPSSLNVVPEQQLDPVRLDHVPRNADNGAEQAVPYHIANGDWLYGTPNKSMFGTTQNGLVHRILLSTSFQSACDDVGGQFPDAAVTAVLQFINCMMRLTVAYLDETGFSMGLADIAVGHLPTPSGERLQTGIDRLRYGDAATKTPGIEALVDDLIRGHYATERAVARGDTTGEGAYPPMLRVTRLESRITGAVAKRQADMFALAMHTIARQRPRNNLLQTVDCGSKGNITNVGQMIACVGQQLMFGRRLCDDNLFLESNYESADPVLGQARRLMAPFRERTRPHYVRGYPGAVEGGFVLNSLLEGITPNSMFDYTISGRSGLTDTACKTAETGYVQRKNIKFCEDHAVAHDTTVRNCDNRIVSFAPGDGVRFDPSFLVWTRCTPMLLSDRDFARCVVTDADADTRFVAYWSLLYDDTDGSVNQRIGVDVRTLVDRERAELYAARDFLRALPNNDEKPGQMRTVGNVESVLVDALCDSRQCLLTPSFALCAYHAPLDWSLGEDERAHCSADVVVDAYRRDRARQSAAHLTVLDLGAALEIVRQWLDAMRRWADAVTLANLRLRLAAKQLLLRHCASREALELFMQRYAHALMCARMSPGEAIGVIASQSSIEPLTQQTLRTLHGVGNTMKEVTQGVPRYKELASVRPTKTMATPIVLVRLAALGQPLDALRAAVRAALCAEFGRDLAPHLDAVLGRPLFAERALELRNDSISISHAHGAALARAQPAAGEKRKQSNRQPPADVSEAADRAQRQERDALLEQTFGQLDAWHAAQRAQTLDAIVAEWHVCKTNELAQRRGKKLGADERSLEALRELFSHCADAGVLFCVLVEPSVNRARNDALTYAFWEAAGVVAPHLALQTGALQVQRASGVTVAIAIGTTSQARLYTQMRLQSDSVAVHCAPTCAAASAERLASLVGSIPRLHQLLGDDALPDTQDAARSKAALAMASLARDLQRSALADAVQTVEVLYAPLVAAAGGGARLAVPLPDEDANSQIDDFHRLDDSDAGALSSFLGVVRIDYRWFQAAGISRAQLIELAMRAIDAAPADGSREHPAHVVYVNNDNAHGDCILHVRVDRRCLPELRERALADGATPLVPSVALLDDAMLDEPPLDADDLAAMRTHQYQLWEEGATALDASYYVGERRRELGLIDTFDNRLQAQRLLAALSERRAALQSECRARRGAHDEVFEELAQLLDLIADAVARVGTQSPELVVRLRRYFADYGLPEPPGCAEATHVARRVAITQADLDAQAEELATAAEVNELHRTLSAICQLQVNADVLARYIDFEPAPRTVYTSEGGVEVVEEMAASVDSRSFRSVLAQRGVDVRTAQTNAVRDAESVLGIEAARRVHFIEYQRTLENCDVAACYLGAICDAQSFHGYLVPMTRHGAEYNDRDRLKLATFEESSNVTTQAAIEAAQIDDINSPSALMMFGVQDTGRFGTGASKLVIDPAAAERVVLVQPDPAAVVEMSGAHSEYDQFAAAWPGAADEQAVERTRLGSAEPDDGDDDDGENDAYAAQNREFDALAAGLGINYHGSEFRAMRTVVEGYDPERPAIAPPADTFVLLDAPYSPTRPGLDEPAVQRVPVPDPDGIVRALDELRQMQQRAATAINRFDID